MSGFGPHYHVGIVVPDLEAAQRALTDLLDVTWGPVLHFDELELRDGAGRDIVVPNTICYSVDAPSIELIEEVPGSVWATNEHSNLHHIGFWSDDLPGASSQLAESGCPLQVCGRAAGLAPTSFVYHGHPLGIRLEVVDAALRPMMEFLFRPPAPPPATRT
jgi:hypothetical protein